MATSLGYGSNGQQSAELVELVPVKKLDHLDWFGFSPRLKTTDQLILWYQFWHQQLWERYHKGDKIPTKIGSGRVEIGMGMAIPT